MHWKSDYHSQTIQSPKKVKNKHKKSKQCSQLKHIRWKIFFENWILRRRLNRNQFNRLSEISYTLELELLNLIVKYCSITFLTISLCIFRVWYRGVTQFKLLAYQLMYVIYGSFDCTSRISFTLFWKLVCYINREIDSFVCDGYANTKKKRLTWKA